MKSSITNHLHLITLESLAAKPMPTISPQTSLLLSLHQLFYLAIPKTKRVTSFMICKLTKSSPLGMPHLMSTHFPFMLQLNPSPKQTLTTPHYNTLLIYHLLHHPYHPPSHLNSLLHHQLNHLTHLTLTHLLHQSLNHQLHLLYHLSKHPL